MVTRGRSKTSQVSAEDHGPTTPPQEATPTPPPPPADEDMATPPVENLAQLSQDPPGEKPIVDASVLVAVDLEAEELEDNTVHTAVEATVDVDSVLESVEEELADASVATSNVATGTTVNGRTYSQIVPGIAAREDSFALPVLGPHEKWEWVPKHDMKLVVMKDFALAASNAVKDVWEDDDVLIGTCSWHAGSHWVEDTGKKFLIKKENKSLIKNDLEALKNCPYSHLVELYTNQMLLKWKTVYKEQAISEKWQFWVNQKSIMTRIQLNEGNPLKCGFPSDNNAIEVGNCMDKKFFNREIKDAISFLHALKGRVQHVSEADLRFGGRLKSPVHSAVFYEEVHSVLNARLHGDVTWMDVKIKVQNSNHGIPEGSFIIPTQKCLQEVDFLCKRDKVSDIMWIL